MNNKIKLKGALAKRLGLVLLVLLIFPFVVVAQDASDKVVAQDVSASSPVNQEEMDSVLAPIALYPDSLISQILVASTYPLEIVQAQRFVVQNKGLAGDDLTKALEKENWDPSVKSLVNFPQVLEMMNEKLDWTQKLGDAVLADQKAVMDTVQKLRAKAQAEGNLKSSEEQKVIVEKETIIIESADPQVVYVPAYNPTVVYGVWWWPLHPPYYYYPAWYVPTATPYAFATGVAVGAAWGYAWGHANWDNGHVEYNNNQNININNNIDRSKYQAQVSDRMQSGQAGSGPWQHDASHRKGVSYRDQATAQKYNRASTTDMAKARDSFRGHDGVSTRPSGSGIDRSTLNKSGSRESAFGGYGSGSRTSSYSSRGASSRSSMSSSSRGSSGSYGGGTRSSGSSASRGGSGGSRGGGGGSRGGGGRR